MGQRRAHLIHGVDRREMEHAVAHHCNAIPLVHRRACGDEHTSLDPQVLSGVVVDISLVVDERELHLELAAIGLVAYLIDILDVIQAVRGAERILRDSGGVL